MESRQSSRGAGDSAARGFPLEVQPDGFWVEQVLGPEDPFGKRLAVVARFDPDRGLQKDGSRVHTSVDVVNGASRHLHSVPDCLSLCVEAGE